ncbi:MAG: RNA methyltransferase [Clostridia bacterium]|nr:RNA methyltransferase [Clostridia bacterium]
MLSNKEVITSRQNPTVKQICALLDKKARRESGLFRFDGLKLFCEAIACGLSIERVVLSRGAAVTVTDAVEREIESGRLEISRVICVSDEVFSKLSEERAPEGIVTVARAIEHKHRALRNAGELRVKSGERLLLCEALRDPGNLGTVIRSCAALGVERLVISDDCADLYNPKTIRAAMGGLFRTEIDIIPSDSFADAIALLREGGRRVYAAALHRDAKVVGELELRPGDCFVIGNEGHGLSQTVIDACDACAIIPMTEGSESLNAAAAAAICIWETVRAK